MKLIVHSAGCSLTHGWKVWYMELTLSNYPRLPVNYLTLRKVYVIDSFTEQSLVDVGMSLGSVHFTH